MNSTRPPALELGNFIANLHFEGIPADVTEKAKLHLIDSIGCGLAGRREPFITPLLNSFADEATIRGGATVFGFAKPLAAEFAAIVNGASIHALDYDDTHMEAHVHLGASIVAAGLAQAEALGASGRELLVAIAAAYEVTIRLGLASLWHLHDQGFHGTGVLAAFGAAVVSAKLRRLDEVATAHAIAICTSQAAGIRAYRTGGGYTKRLHPGWAAHSGMLAARLAASGFEGPIDGCLEGPSGFFAAHLGPEKAAVERITVELGSIWHIRKAAIKPYPCCHQCHAHMDALAYARAAHPFLAEEVAQVECGMSESPARVVFEPIDRKLRPRNVDEARLSLPYCAAGFLVVGSGGPELFQSALLRDERILALAQRIRHIDDQDSTYPEYFSAFVRIRLRDGTLLERREPFNRGSDRAPMTWAQVRTKFLENAGIALSLDQSEVLLAILEGIEGTPSLQGLARNLRQFNRTTIEVDNE